MNSLLILGCVLGVRFMVRLCSSLSYPFQCIFFFFLRGNYSVCSCSLYCHLEPILFLKKHEKKWNHFELKKNFAVTNFYMNFFLGLEVPRSFRYPKFETLSVGTQIMIINYLGRPSANPLFRARSMIESLPCHLAVLRIDCFTEGTELPRSFYGQRAWGGAHSFWFLLVPNSFLQIPYEIKDSRTFLNPLPTQDRVILCAHSYSAHFFHNLTLKYFCLFL